MSRCFPYPPPGYSPNTASNYALIESIKLQRDKERVKLERKKEKKRKKKERNRKKGKKAKQETTSSCSRIGDLISEGDNRESGTKYLQKDDNEIVEWLENSSLSEEHGQPVCSQDLSYSSDSTQNNNKRKRSTSPSNGIHDHGTVVRIRLSSHKHEQCDISNKQDCFKESAKYEVERAPPLLKTNKQLSPLMFAPGQHSSLEDKTTTASCSKSHENDIELLFKNLIINCALPSFHYEFDDQDWLFQRKHEQMRVKEKGEVSNDVSCGTSALLPRAQYLHDAELYAFPFTVPF